MPATPATYDFDEPRHTYTLADGRVVVRGSDGQLWTWSKISGQHTVCRSDEAVEFLTAHGVELNAFERNLLRAVQPAYVKGRLDDVAERRSRGRPRREDAA